MGCTESRDQGIKAELKNYTVIQGAFVSAASNNGGYVLAPLDQLEFNWKKTLPESQGYGSWSERALTLDEELKAGEADEAWAMSLTNQIKNWCRQHPSALRKGIQSNSNLVF